MKRINLRKIAISAFAVLMSALLLAGCAGNDGKSAYELAVDNGYNGSLEEWLDSLAGEDGKDGSDGTNGEDGRDASSSSDKTVNAGSTINVTTEGSTGVEYAAAKGLLSAVSIRCSFQTVDFFGRKGSSTSAGSGVIYQIDKESGEALIITNYHVVYSQSSVTDNGICDSIKVYLYGSESYLYNDGCADMSIDARYIGGSMQYDIAVLYVEDSDVIKSSSAEAVDFDNSDSITVGQTAIAIGNPEAAGISVTSGVISVVSEYIDMTAVDNQSTITLRTIRVDTAVNSGNSGGGLYNEEGKLIGIVNAKNADSSVDNIGYAIPSNIVRAITDNILYYCSDGSNECVKRAIIGIRLVRNSTYAVYNSETGMLDIVEEVAVEQTDSGSLSDGKILAGDIIKTITVGNKTTAVTRLYTIIDAMLDARAGDVVKIGIIRDGAEKTVEITVTEACLTEY